MMFKRNKTDKPGRSKYVEPPKVFISIGRTVNLGNFNSIKFDAGFSGSVGDTLTVMKESAVAIQENETAADAFKRAFDIAVQEMDRQADFYRIPKLREWLDFLNPNKPKPATQPVTGTNTTPEKATKPALPQAGTTAKPVQAKKSSIAEQIAAETEKLKERGNK